MLFMLKNTYSVIILHFMIYDNTKFVAEKLTNANQKIMKRQWNDMLTHVVIRLKFIRWQRIKTRILP